MSDNNNELRIESGRFTTAAALVKEVATLLADAGCTVVVLAPRDSWDQIVEQLQECEHVDRVRMVELTEEDEEGPCTPEH